MFYIINSVLFQFTKDAKLTVIASKYGLTMHEGNLGIFVILFFLPFSVMFCNIEQNNERALSHDECCEYTCTFCTRYFVYSQHEHNGFIAIS